MRKVISASRRTDLVASFPEWLSSVFNEEKVCVYGPSGHTYTVDLRPQAVHTVVLWSKDFSNFIEDQFGLQKALAKYSQIYLHFTITGLGETFIEQGVPCPSKAISQLDPLIKIVGRPERISVRFDPVVYWIEEKEVKTNLYFFEEIATKLAARGIKDIRVSFAQWYGKARRRAAKHGFLYIDPPKGKKKKDAQYLAGTARSLGLRLYSCSQNFLADVQGIQPSSCINGPLLQRLHPFAEPVSSKRDRTQRTECGCTESTDIGSYTQFCPHACLYCYANPLI